MSKPVQSLNHIRAKIYGHKLSARAFGQIVADINAGRFRPEHTAAFLTACASHPLDADELYSLTKAMVQSGQKLSWTNTPVVDKHCVGGLPGNRTTPIIVSIVAAAGLIIPKTSSRAITSASGTADTMEVFAPVDLDSTQMCRVVEKEGGCVVWGGNVGLSPVDDDLVRVARELEFDGPGQLVASVLSKKIAAGATHVVIDIPIGPTAKIKDTGEADELSKMLIATAKNFGLSVILMKTDGSQPVGDGIGPALEARDVLNVLRNTARAPNDLKARAASLAACLLEIGGKAEVGAGRAMALELLQSGAAWRKFEAICDAQGGMREIPKAARTHTVLAQRSGDIVSINNLLISRLARLTGAPEDKAAGLDLHIQVGDIVYKDQPIFTLHAVTQAQIDRVLEVIEVGEAAIEIIDLEEKIRRNV